MTDNKWQESTVVLLYTNIQIGPFLLTSFLNLQYYFVVVEKDGVKTRPVMKQAWPVAWPSITNIFPCNLVTCHTMPPSIIRSIEK